MILIWNIVQKTGDVKVSRENFGVAMKITEMDRGSRILIMILIKNVFNSVNWRKIQQMYFFLKISFYICC